MKKILVTGASGFIAPNLINECLRKKYNVVGVDLKDKDETFPINNKNYKKQFSILTDQKYSSVAWFGIPFLLSSTQKKYKVKVMSKLNQKGIITRPIISGNFANQPSIKLYKIKSNLVDYNKDTL